MKRLGIASAVLCAAAAANAQSIGLQLTGSGNGGGTGLAPSDTAGVVSQANWNVGSGQSGSVANLVDSTGASTGIGVTWSADDSWTTGTTANSGTNTGDFKLLSGEDKTRGSATYTFSNVPAGTYDVIAYTVNDVHNEGKSTIGSATLYNVDQNGGDWNTNHTYVASSATTDPGTSATPTNYIEFTNVSPTSGTITLTHSFVAKVDSDTVSYNGIQLVPVSVPEPASVGVLAVGGLGLLARRRRAM